MLPSSSDGTVDINQLPAGIVGNVEVITGGASAVYGSDAVSGVVNFKTKRAQDGLDVSAAFGTTKSYGGSIFDVNAVGGLNSSDGRGNITFAVEYTRRSKVNRGSVPFEATNHSGVTPLKTGQYVPGTNAPSQAAVDAYFAQFGAPAGAVPRSPGPGFGFNADGTLFTVGPNPNKQIYNLQPDLNSQGRIVTEVGAGSARNRDYEAYPLQTSLERWSSFVKGDWALDSSTHFYGEALYTNYNSYYRSAATVTSATQVPTVPLSNPFLANIIATQPLFAAILASRPTPGAPHPDQQALPGLGRVPRLDHRQQHLSVHGRSGRCPGRHHDLGRLCQPWPDPQHLFQHGRQQFQPHAAAAQRAGWRRQPLRRRLQSVRRQSVLTGLS